MIGNRLHILTELVERLQVALLVDHLSRHIAAHAVGAEDSKDLVAGLQSAGKFRQHLVFGGRKGSDDGMIERFVETFPKR